MSFKEFMQALGNDKVEGELMQAIFISVISSLLLIAIFYFTILDKSVFIQKYGFFLFFAMLSYALIIPSAIHIRAYREFPCMSGMMIGMTIGMISGFLPGFFVGATNGFFYGSVFGMAVGIFFGIWNGRCCGIMGVIEGIMAGFMGGLMGAMTAVMMLNDHIKVASLILYLISAVILIGLNYMVYKETREIEREHKKDSFFTIFWSAFLILLTLLMMVFGPRSFLFT